MPKSRISNTLSGATWFEGTGAPGPSTGHKTCFYLDTATGEVYEKITATAWTLRGDITAPVVTGTWYTGSGAPAAALGLTGDFYEDTDVNGLVYRKTGPLTWVESLTSKLKTNQVNVANGVCPLDAGAKVPTANLPSSLVGALVYQGGWDASGGTYPPGPAQGQYWVITVAGTLSGTPVLPGDWIVYNGTSWDIIDHQDVNGTWLSGAGVPAGALGGVGDYYEDTSPTGYIYRKTGPTTWTTAWSKVSGISSTWEVYTGPKVLSGTYEGNVKVNGNASISASVVVKGTLWVTGNLTQSAIGALEVWGDLKVGGECNLTPSDDAELSNVTIKGNAELNTESYQEDKYQIANAAIFNQGANLQIWSTGIGVVAPIAGETATVLTGIYAGITGTVSNVVASPMHFDLTPAVPPPALGDDFSGTSRYKFTSLGTYTNFRSTYFKSKTTKALFSVDGNLTVYNFFANPRDAAGIPVAAQPGSDLSVGGNVYSPKEVILNDSFDVGIQGQIPRFPIINLSARQDATAASYAGGDGGDITVKGILYEHDLNVNGQDNASSGRGGDTGSVELGAYQAHNQQYGEQSIGTINAQAGTSTANGQRGGNVNPFVIHGKCQGQFIYLIAGTPSGTNSPGGSIGELRFGDLKLDSISVYAANATGTAKGGGIGNILIQGNSNTPWYLRRGGCSIATTGYRGALASFECKGDFIGAFSMDSVSSAQGIDPADTEGSINFRGDFIGAFDFYQGLQTLLTPDSNTFNFYGTTIASNMYVRLGGSAALDRYSNASFNFYGHATITNNIALNQQGPYTNPGTASEWLFKGGCVLESIQNVTQFANVNARYTGYCQLRAVYEGTPGIKHYSKGCTLAIDRLSSGTPTLYSSAGNVVVSSPHTKLYIGADDVTNQGRWTELAAGLNSRIYKFTSNTVLSGTYDGSVFVFGNASYTATPVVINGDLYVSGDLSTGIGMGTSFTVNGNVVVDGNATIGDDAAATVPVVKGSIVCRGLTGLSIYGVSTYTFTASDIQTSNDLILNNLGTFWSLGNVSVGGNLNAQMMGGSRAITIYGDLIVTGLYYGDGQNATKRNGTTLTVYGNFRCTGFTNQGWSSNDASIPGSSGSVRVDGDVMCVGTWSAYGGGASSSTPQNAGNGGSITCYGDFHCSGSMNLYGGTNNSSSANYNGGGGGSVTVTRGRFVVGSDFSNRGGNSTNGNGGAGGSITTQDDVSIQGNYTSQGGNGLGTNGVGGNAGEITTKNSIWIQRNINSYGGQGNSTSGTGGNGATFNAKTNITLGSSVANIYGGNGNTGGNGGNFFAASTSNSGVHMYGGAGTGSSGSGGNGGSFSITDYVEVWANGIDARGGDSSASIATGNGGAGGSIYVNGNLVADGFLYTYGGNNTTAGGGSGGAGGTIQILGFARCKNIFTDGGYGQTGGGNAGSITIKGDAVILGYLRGQGTGSSVSGNGGNGANVTIYGNLTLDEASNGYIWLRGGNGGSGNVNGGSGGNLFVGGSAFIQVSTSSGWLMNGGDGGGTDGTAGSGGSITIQENLTIKMDIGVYALNQKGGFAWGAARTGGSGGSVTVHGDVNIMTGTFGSAPSWNLDGGSSAAYNGGPSGAFTIYGSTKISSPTGGLSITLTAKGGNANSAGNGGGHSPSECKFYGPVIINGPTSACTWDFSGGNAGSTPGNTAGQGAYLTFFSSLHIMINTTIQTNGGNTGSSTAAARGGNITCRGFVSGGGNLITKGGNSSSGQAGASGNVYLLGGAILGLLQATDGTGTASSTAFSVNLLGDIRIHTINVQNRASAYIQRGSGAYGTLTMKVDYFTAKNQFYNPDSTLSGVLTPLNAFYVCGDTGKLQVFNGINA